MHSLSLQSYMSQSYMSQSYMSQKSYIGDSISLS